MFVWRARHARTPASKTREQASRLSSKTSPHERAGLVPLDGFVGTFCRKRAGDKIAECGFQIADCRQKSLSTFQSAFRNPKWS